MCIKIKKIPNIPCLACLHNDCTYFALVFFFLILCFGGFSPLQNNSSRLQKSLFQISIFKKSPMQRKDRVPYRRIPNNICRYTPPSRRWGLILSFLKVELDLVSGCPLEYGKGKIVTLQQRNLADTTLTWWSGFISPVMCILDRMW